MNKLFRDIVFTRSLIIVMFHTKRNKKGRQGIFKGALVQYQIFTDNQSAL